MNPEKSPARARRVRGFLLTLTLVVSVTVLSGAAIFLAEQRRFSLDVTSTREHSLAPRTRLLLNRLDGPHELAIVASGEGMDERSRLRLLDLLSAVDRASTTLRVTWIDPSTDAGRTEFDALLPRLADLRRSEIDAATEALCAADETAESIADPVESLSPRIEALRDAARFDDDTTQAMSRLAAVARVRSRELREAGEAMPEGATYRAGSVLVADIEIAKTTLGSILQRSGEDLATMTAALEQIGARDSLGDTAAQARDLAREAARLRDQLLTAADRFSRAAPARVLPILKLLQNRAAAVLVSPDDIVAIRIESIVGGGDAGAAEVRFAAEEAIAQALAAVAGGPAPIIALVHAEASNLLDEHGRPISPDIARAIGALLHDLSARNITLTEWPAASDQPRPTPGRGGLPTGRPVVWVVIPTGAASPDAAARMGKLVDAVGALLDDGESMLVSLEPSTLPRVGEPDPLAALFEPLGLVIDTGRPLVRTVATPQGQATVAQFRITSANTQTDIGPAIDGLATTLILPSPISIASPETEGEEPMFAPLLTVPAEDTVWGESQWLNIRAARAQPAQKDPRLDNVDGPWTVAVVGERWPSGADNAQRLVVVSSNGWFLDPIARQAQMVEGRAVDVNPGNAELFDASIDWLAGRDDLLAPTTRTTRAARVRDIPPGQLALLRWALILVPPAAVLLLGALLRITRG